MFNAKLKYNNLKFLAKYFTAKLQLHFVKLIFLTPIRAQKTFIDKFKRKFTHYVVKFDTRSMISKITLCERFWKEWEAKCNLHLKDCAGV